MTWSSIRIDLARNIEFPSGSSRHGYFLHAPLSPRGDLDLGEFEQAPARAVVEEYWGDKSPRRGRLTHSNSNLWSFSFDQDGEEPIFQFGSHRLLPGDYLTVQIPSGENLTFRVTSVISATIGKDGSSSKEPPESVH